MALTLIKEDGTGKVDANAYANAADGDAYHEGHLYATAWTAATEGQQAAALVMATRLIDSQFQFGGTRANAVQALQWPREDCRDPDADDWNGGTVASDVVPKSVVEATCEMARELLIADRTAAPAGGGKTRAALIELLGGVEIGNQAVARKIDENSSNRDFAYQER